MVTPTHILDTDLFSAFARNAIPKLMSRIAAASPGTLTVSVITIEESLGGWYAALRQATRPDLIERIYAELATTTIALGRFPFANYTQAAMGRYEALNKLKLNVRKNDLRIAAIALELGAVVVSRNLRDFTRVPGLAVEDWAA